MHRQTEMARARHGARRSRRLLAAALAAGALTATAVAAAAGPPVMAGRPVQVTGASAYPASCSNGWDAWLNSETEVSLAASPLDPRRLAATYMQDASVAHPVSVSSDAGRSWSESHPTGQTTCNGGAAYSMFDPWVSYGADGRLYLSGATGAEPGTGDTVAGAAGQQDFLARHVLVQTSTDDGRTWSTPVSAGGDVDNGYVIDKPTVTADTTRAGSAYATWTRIQIATGTAVVAFSRTRDGGTTWQQSVIPVTFPGARGVVFGSQVSVLPNGELLMFLTEAIAQPQVLLAGPVDDRAGSDVLPRFLGDSRFYVLRSADQGLNWSAPTAIGAAPTFPQVAYGAVGPDGHAYAAWAVESADGGSAIVLASSPDGGRTWGAPQTLAPSSHRATVPVVAVDGEGNVAVTWYEDRAWVAVSSNHGASWSSQPITEALDLTAAPDKNTAGGAQLGDYEGLVGLDRGFVAAFAVPQPYATRGSTDVYAVRIGLPNVR